MLRRLLCCVSLSNHVSFSSSLFTHGVSWGLTYSTIYWILVITWIHTHLVSPIMGKWCRDWLFARYIPLFFFFVQLFHHSVILIHLFELQVISQICEEGFPQPFFRWKKWSLFSLFLSSNFTWKTLQHCYSIFIYYMNYRLKYS